MPIEKDLKVAYDVLYEEGDPKRALELYNRILKESPKALNALIYKAACYEKLYFGDKQYRTIETLDEAKSCLAEAEDVAMERGDRAKIGLVYFRFFVHHFNLKYYKMAETYLKRAKSYGYADPTLALWEDKLKNKLAKMNSEHGDDTDKKGKSDLDVPTEAVKTINIDDTKPTPPDMKVRTDWYQSTDKLTVSFFTTILPANKDSMDIKIEGLHLSISYPIPDKGSEFQYNIDLAHNVDPQEYSVIVMSKKFEITFKKLENIKWKSLEYEANTNDLHIPPTATTNATGNNRDSLSYPNSSKKKIDWSKIDIDDDETDQNQSTDAFFQQLYADADPDTRRAMMKSFIESNGTTLNTNWEEVKKAPVETSLPEGQELKEW